MNGNFKNLVGQKFGKLTVVKYDKERSDLNSNKCTRSYWICKCDCGSEPISVRADALIGGVRLSCGCEKKARLLSKTIQRLQGSVWGNLIYVRFVKRVKTNNYILVRCTCGNQEVVNEKMLKKITECSVCRDKHALKKHSVNFIDIKGSRFGNLVVKHHLYGDKWLCECDCGNYFIAYSSLLRNGKTVACSICNRKHGHHSRFIDLTGKVFGMLHVDSFKGYINGHSYWNCTCSCPDKTKVIVDSYKLRSGATTSCGCRFIQHRGSNAEHEICEWLKVNFPDIILETHNKTILDGKEIDIFIVNKNIGIEYNGSEWHSSLGAIFDDKPKYYHRDKFLLAKSKGVHLISIFDIDWHNNQEKIKNYLSSVLNDHADNIHAKDCQCLLIDDDRADNFISMYHIHGCTYFNSINYGLFFGGDLISVMSFGNLSMNSIECDQYELYGYFTKYGLNIFDGANKLLNHFEQDFNPKYIVYYSDNDYFNGEIYKSLGFIDVCQCIPKHYWYLSGEKVDDTLDIDDCVMLDSGACKVWRSGYTKWEKYY